MQKFRFALTLIDKQIDDNKLLVKNDRGQHLLHALAEATGAGADLENKVSSLGNTGILYWLEKYKSQMKILYVYTYLRSLRITIAVSLVQL